MPRGWLPARRHAADTEPLRLSTFDRWWRDRGACRIRRGWRARRNAGLAGLPHGVPALSRSAFGVARLRIRRRVGAHRSADRRDRGHPLVYRRKARRALSALDVPLMAPGPADLATRGCFRCALPAGQGRGPGSWSSGGEQGLQPFELTDFLVKAAQARAIGRLQPHRRGEVAMPSRPVPVLTPGGCVGPGACCPEPPPRGGDHLGLAGGQTRAAEAICRVSSIWPLSGCGKAGVGDDSRVGTCRPSSADGGGMAPPSTERWVMAMSSG